MINRPKPPPHILKRLKQEEKEKKAKRESRKTEREDPKRMTASAFGVKLQADNESEGIRTQYPFKPPLRKIPEKNEEEEPYRLNKKKDASYLSEQKAKRGKSVNAKFLQSNGFSKNGNNTTYQSNFHETAISTSTSKNFISSPFPDEGEKRKYNRSESLIARSTCYSTVPCPHCDRKFSSAAAERHIPVCKSIINKPISLRESKRKRPSVQLPHLSKTNYSSGFEQSNFINNSASFRLSQSKVGEDQLSKTQTPGLPPTYKANGSKNISNVRKDFALKR